MPKFLDRPCWYENDGRMTYGLGSAQSSFIYGSIFYSSASGTTLNQLVAGSKGSCLLSGGPNVPPYWGSVKLYQHTVFFRANGNYSSPTSPTDFPMYCSNAYISFLSYNSTEVDDENDLMFRLVEGSNGVRYTSGFAHLYTDSDFTDMGLNQQGCRAYGNAQIISNLNMAAAVILKATCTRTLPASTNYPVSSVYIYPSEIVSDQVMPIK